MAEPMLQYDFKLGGPLFKWFDNQAFEAGISEDQTYRTVGWLSHKPKEGHTVLAEFRNSWILFEVVNVDHPRDPSDMFFADLKPIQQEMKETLPNG